MHFFFILTLQCRLTNNHKEIAKPFIEAALGIKIYELRDPEQEKTEQYVLFICPDDIFGAGLPVYSFQNYAAEDRNVALNDRTFKNFYIFNEYEKLPDSHPLKPYLKYFATNTANSSETRAIHDKVEWYRTDGLTQERIMTHEQEIQLAAAFAEEKERERNEKIIAEKDNALAEKDAELAALRAEIERLKNAK